MIVTRFISISALAATMFCCHTHAGIFEAHNNTEIMVVPHTWVVAAQDHKALSCDEKRKAFVDDCKELVSSNKLIPHKSETVVRVVSYDVNYWSNLFNSPWYLDTMIAAIKKIDADIVLLQNVFWDKHLYEKLVKKFDCMGYYHQCFAPIIIGDRDASYGNVILSKYSFDYSGGKTYTDQKPESYVQYIMRGFAMAVVNIPGGEKLCVYSTSLDRSDDTGKLSLQFMKELVDHVQQEKCNNVLVAGNFENRRVCDNDYEIEDKKADDLIIQNWGLGTPPATQALEFLEDNGLRDCFAVGNLKYPLFTSWEGVATDFMYVSPQWSLPVAGCYLYFNSTSGHVPVIMDVALGQ